MKGMIARNWFPASAGMICFVWALIGWATVIPNQDILADGIQAQSLISSPHLVLAFPGQKHGGPLEYPYTILAEWVAPGNYFVNAGIRPVLALMTGFVVAKLFTQLFSQAPKWTFLAAIGVGPTIIHGLLGPQGNEVGQWWMQPNWDMAWLLVSAGALFVAWTGNSEPVRETSSGRDSRKFRSGMCAGIGGLLIGLGFFAHPAITLLIIPLAVLVTLRLVPAIRIAMIASVGVVLGVAPSAISYIINSKINTWDPSHIPFISIDYYRNIGGAVLGLTGIPDYMNALLPYSVGLAPSTSQTVGRLQSAFMWIFIAVIVTSSVVGVFNALRRGRRLTPGAAVAVAWVTSAASMMLFITFVDAVWIYSSGLAILFWLSLGAMPIFFRSRTVGLVTTSLFLCLTLSSTVAHNFDFYSKSFSNFSKKLATQNENIDLAKTLISDGAEAVFGSYYDVIPIGYASAGKLRTLTNHYNRFPLTQSELSEKSITIAINTQPRDAWGAEALQSVLQGCRNINQNGTRGSGSYSLFRCPSEALVFNR